MRAHTVRPVRPVRPRRAAALAAGAALASVAATTAALGSGSAAAADPDRPSVRLHAARDVVTVHHRPGRPGVTRIPVHVASVGGTFDLRVQRPGADADADYGAPFAITQVVHGDSEVRVPLDLEVRSLRGLPRFARIDVTGPDGHTWQVSSGRFCPNGYDAQRIDPDGADRPGFPDSCGGSGVPFVLGTTWGIDDGWATPLAGHRPLLLDRGNGRYDVTVTIRPRYVTAFGIAPQDATVTTAIRLRRGEGGDHHRGAGRAAGAAGAAGAASQRALTRAPVDETPPEEALPDLRTLPSFGISTHSRRGRDLLAFGATVWVGGNSLLDIEGFRRSDEDVMDAWQYFYDGTEVVGRAPVGALEFDRRRGHHHWHLLQFARYRLLDGADLRVTKSRKQSFCIVPTDPVDLALDGAEHRPYQTGLGSACGADEALWIRETLPLGWGDTYFQQRGGQAFDITDVENGTYYVSVEANPTGELFETDETNNVSLREVRLGGRPGNRTVCVPAYEGLDEHGSC